jgi:hypothetical protein
VEVQFYSLLTSVPQEGVGWDSVVGIMTCYRLDGPGIESQCGRGFQHTGPWAHAVQWVLGLFPRGKAAGGVALTTHPHLVPRLKKEYSYTTTPPLGLCGQF